MHFEPISDEVLLVNMHDEVALRKDFGDARLVFDDPGESVQRYVNVKTDFLVIKDFTSRPARGTQRCDTP